MLIDQKKNMQILYYSSKYRTGNLRKKKKTYLNFYDEKKEYICHINKATKYTYIGYPYEKKKKCIACNDGFLNTCTSQAENIDESRSRPYSLIYFSLSLSSF